VEILTPLHHTGKQENSQCEVVIVFNNKKRFNKGKKKYYYYNIPKISPNEEYIAEDRGNQHFSDENEYADQKISKVKF